MARVFLSYSHDDAEHTQRVAAFARRLRADGVDLLFDVDMLPGGPSEGWPAWSEAQVRNSERTLIVSTAEYRARYELEATPGIGLGAVCEARAIRQYLHDSGGKNDRFRIVVLAREHESTIPHQ